MTDDIKERFVEDPRAKRVAALALSTEPGVEAVGIIAFFELSMQFASDVRLNSC